MTATATVRERRTTAEIAPVPAPRLVLVELRKQVDTRSGRWLLALIVLVDAVVIALMLAVADRPYLTWSELTVAVAAGQMLLLPLIGVLAATSEWSQRTALTTFTLEPRRTRVALAKLVASGVLAIGVMVTTLALSAAANLLGVVLRDGDGSWTPDWGMLAGNLLGLLLLATQGIAFGLALLSTPAAIVAYLVIPTVWTILTTLVEALRTPAEWLDMSGPLLTLMTGGMTDGDWPRLGTSVLVWVALPLAFGLWRTARRDVA